MTLPLHLFADISGHGFGHLLITAPVLNALAGSVPNLRLTVRMRLPGNKLEQRTHTPFELIEDSANFGYVMHDATRIDFPARRWRHPLFAARRRDRWLHATCSYAVRCPAKGSRPDESISQ